MERAIKKTKGARAQVRSGAPMERETLYLLIRKSQRIRTVYQTTRNREKKGRNHQSSCILI